MTASYKDSNINDQSLDKQNGDISESESSDPFFSNSHLQNKNQVYKKRIGLYVFLNIFNEEVLKVGLFPS
jgi:hypothetical protein